MSTAPDPTTPAASITPPAPNARAAPTAPTLADIEARIEQRLTRRAEIADVLEASGLAHSAAIIGAAEVLIQQGQASTAADAIAAIRSTSPDLLVPYSPPRPKHAPINPTMAHEPADAHLTSPHNTLDPATLSSAARGERRGLLAYLRARRTAAR